MQYSYGEITILVFALIFIMWLLYKARHFILDILDAVCGMFD
ncbi:hypothetical protein phiAS4_ORF0031 [Aeromonas phage phiAS4]|uniref:Uncharacterized protein n=1 Tax=Aeromonas phage phiAS4 TaxID=879628 RepID=E1A179_9CAUD|nr:hypothetical protein phiAS4_ORF0031 [Aeromonas phage phiAS4]ADM79603.1 hypothetical protein phiAS4_ORF0031 [Aeromonas phage phiAS4]